jgi:hypothetical protein
MRVFGLLPDCGAEPTSRFFACWWYVTYGVVARRNEGEVRYGLGLGRFLRII